MFRMSTDGVESDLKRLNNRKVELVAKRREQTAALKSLDDQLTGNVPTANDAQITKLRHAIGLLLSALRTGEREMAVLSEMERRLNAEHEFWQKNRAG
jgi:hypothetical protein